MMDLVDQFLDYLSIERGLSNNTIKSYKQDLLKFTEYAKSRNIKKLKEIKKADISRYLYFLKDKGLSSSSISRNLVAIRIFFRFLTGEKILDEDVTMTMESPRLMHSLPDVLDISEIIKILEMPDARDLLGIRDKAVLELMYATGMRVSEVVELVMDSLNLDVGFIKCTGKGGKERIVPIGKQAKTALAKYLKRARPKLGKKSQDKHLFLSRLGKKICRIRAYKKDSYATHFKTFFRYAPFRERGRFKDCSGNAGPRGYFNNTSLYAYKQIKA